MSVNFSQLRRRQSSREMLYRTQLSVHSSDREEDGGAAAAGDDGGIRDDISRLNSNFRLILCKVARLQNLDCTPTPSTLAQS